MNIRIIRSDKRRRTVQAREVNGTLEILAPAGLSDEELEKHIANLRERIERRKRKTELDDGALERRAIELNHRYFEGILRWESVRWVINQHHRWGSCTSSEGTIRISHRIADMPEFVQDYIIVHELAHLVEPNHGARFWKLVNRYPRTERARGYLMAAGLEELQE